MSRATLRPRRLAVVALVMCAVASLPAAVGAQALPPAQAPAAAAPVPWYEQISLNGMVSTSYVGNFNSPQSRTNQFRVFDTVSGSAQLDVAQLVVQREASKRGDTGFRIEFMGGAVANVTAATGLFRDEDGEAGDFDILQAYLSYVAPAGRGLRFDVGKFTTHIGYEVVDGYEGFNDNQSHSFLFGYAEPVSHTGVRASYPFSDKLSAQVLLVNGWDTAEDNNTGKSIGAQVEANPVEQVSVVVAYMGGPEQRDTNDSIRNVLDTYVVWKAAPRVALALNYAYGWESEVPLPDTAGGGVADATWQGVAGYARYQAWSPLAFAVRVEWFDDPTGARTGYVQSLKELTFTPEYRPHPKLVIRGDVRRDWSNRDVFELSDGTFGTGQTTVSANAIFVF
jgi:hypothetical protein